MRMAFKRQIKLTAATEEAKWEATIPSPSDAKIKDQRIRLAKPWSCRSAKRD